VEGQSSKGEGLPKTEEKAQHKRTIGRGIARCVKRLTDEIALDHEIGIANDYVIQVRKDGGAVPPLKDRGKESGEAKDGPCKNDGWEKKKGTKRNYLRRILGPQPRAGEGQGTGAKS